MADFVQTMKQWRRMCKKHTCSRNNYAFTGLPICPIAATHEGYPCDEDPIDWTEKATKQLEEIVMLWAAENPEPVYPTWGDYVTIKMLEDITHRNDTTPQTLGEWMRKTPIPADIAEKLGLEPKEGA